MSIVWRLDTVTKRFRSGGWLSERREHVAMRDVSLAVAEGDRVGVIGESGSGKTTLARVGLGLIAPDSGSVKLFGQDTAGWGRARWRAARHDAQLLFQDPRAMLNPSMTLGALLRESARLHDRNRDPAAAAESILARVGLEGRAGAYPGQLSGGERRRAGIARLLLARPRLVVADEPTTGLDAALKADLVQLLVDRVGARCAVVLISHDLPLVLWACSRVVVMQDGRVVDRFATEQVGRVEHHAHTIELLQAAGLEEPRPEPAQGSA